MHLAESGHGPGGTDANNAERKQVDIGIDRSR